MISAFVSGVIPSLAPDWGTLLAGVGTGATDAATAVLPLAIPILVLLAGLGIAIRVFGKFGVKR